MRIVSPTVFATLNWLSLLREGKAFYYSGQSSPAASNYGHVQLLNPAASGITVIVRNIVANAPGGSGNVRIRYYNTALTTDDSAAIENALRGGGAATAEARLQANTSLFGDPVLGHRSDVTHPPIVWPEWICELAPGEGVLVANDQTNASIQANYAWVELTN